jgi:hypothetical protein
MAWMTRHQFMCRQIVDSFCCPFSFLIQLVLKVKQQVDSSLLIQVVAGSVVEGASMMFYGYYKKRCLLTILASQILLLTKLIYENKEVNCGKRSFYYIMTFLTVPNLMVIVSTLTQFCKLPRQFWSV